MKVKIVKNATAHRMLMIQKLINRTHVTLISVRVNLRHKKSGCSARTDGGGGETNGNANSEPQGTPKRKK
jgi:hypothetical protein